VEALRAPSAGAPGVRSMIVGQSTFGWLGADPRSGAP